MEEEGSGLTGLVLVGHEEDGEALDELLSDQGDGAHVEEDAEEDGHGDELDDGSEDDGEADEDVRHHRRHPLLVHTSSITPFTQGLSDSSGRGTKVGGLLAGRGDLGGDAEGVQVDDGDDSRWIGSLLLITYTEEGMGIPAT